MENTTLFAIQLLPSCAMLRVVVGSLACFKAQLSDVIHYILFILVPI